MGSHQQSKYIKLETALLFSFISLLIGFIGGVVFSAFKLGNDADGMKGMPPASVSDSLSGQHALPHNIEHLVESLKKKLAAAPDDANAWIELGNIYFDHQMVEDAMRAYREALKIQPENADVWTDLGVMYRRAGNSNEAVAAFQKAQIANPRHEVALFNEGVVQMHDLNNPKDAIRAWEKLLEINPNAQSPGGQPVKDIVSKLKQKQ